MNNPYRENAYVDAEKRRIDDIHSLCDWLKDRLEAGAVKFDFNEQLLASPPVGVTCRFRVNGVPVRLKYVGYKPGEGDSWFTFWFRPPVNVWVEFKSDSLEEVFSRVYFKALFNRIDLGINGKS